MADFSCQLYCKPDQNKYVKVLEKLYSFLKYHENKTDAKTINAKISLKIVDDFFNNCRNVKIMGDEGRTLEEVIEEHVSYRLFWSMFNDLYFVEVDFMMKKARKHFTCFEMY